MKNIILIITSIFVGFIIGYVYCSDISSDLSEDVIMKEILLLNSHSKTPTCEEIIKSNNKISQVIKEGSYITWRYYEDKNVVKKAIVSPDMIVAYEEFSADCELP